MTGDDLAEKVAAVLRKWHEGRCGHCLRPIATDADWDEIPEGEGEHLCWEHQACYSSRADPHEAHAAALVPLIREREAAASFRLSLTDTQRVVDHLIHDGTRDGLILGNLLNAAMGASARRRAAANPYAGSEGER